LIGFLILNVIGTTNLSYDYSNLINEAYDCRYAKEEALNTGIIESLVEIEDLYFQSYNIPDQLRGMLLAAACVESGYNARAKGDWKITLAPKKHPRAKGILQFWQWAEKEYGLNRLDPIQSAHVWMIHIGNTYEKNFCRGYRLTESQKWLGAWAQAVRGRLTKENRYRCFQRTKHWKKLRKWKKNIKNYDEGC
tara:strand:- start:1271 stop:1849 length:579 start_codon:yes stop_codon:yes gene_type:complete